MCQNHPPFDFDSHIARARDLEWMEPHPVPAKGERPRHDPDAYGNVMGRLGELRVCSTLTRAGFPHLDGLYLKHKDRVTQIDHVALAGSAFVIIEVKNWEILGYKFERRERRLEKALRQNDMHAEALRAFLGVAHHIEPLVVVASAYSAFGRHPQSRVWERGLVWESALANKVKAVAVEHPANTTSYGAWEKLMTLRDDEAYMDDARREHRKSCRLPKENSDEAAAWDRTREERLARRRKKHSMQSHEWFF